MHPIKRLIKSDSRKRIQKAIELAESRTSAEIVPMVVLSSTPTAHVFPLLALFFLMISNELFHIIPIDALYPLNAQMAFIFLSCLAVLCAFGLSRFNWIKRLLTSNKEEFRNVERRALVEFYTAQVNTTLSKNGILLFLSIQERKAVVLADKTISDKLDKSVWIEVISTLISGTRSQDLTGGIVNAIQKCADIVYKELPKTAHTKNELPDKLIIKA